MTHKKINILHIVDQLSMGGVQEWIYRIVQFSDKEKFNHTIAYITDENHFKERIEKAGGKIIYLQGGKPSLLKIASPSLWKRCYSLFKNNQYDVVTLHTFASVFFGATLSKLFGIPNVYLYCAPRMQQQWYEKTALDVSSPFINLYMTWYDEKDWNKHMAVPVGKIRKIPEGISLENVNPIQKDKNLFFTELNIKDDESVMLSVGRYHPDKGHLCAIESMQYIIEKYPKLKYVIVGTGALYEKYKKRIAELKLSNNIILTGYKEDLAPYYSAADLYLHSSPYEPPNISSAFAFAYGLPVITYPFRPIHNWLKDRENVIYCNTREPKEIARSVGFLLDNINLRNQVGNQARKDAFKYLNIENFVRGIEDVYFEILKNKID